MNAAKLSTGKTFLKNAFASHAAKACEYWKAGTPAGLAQKGTLLPLSITGVSITPDLKEP